MQILIIFSTFDARITNYSVKIPKPLFLSETNNLLLSKHTKKPQTAASKSSGLKRKDLETPGETLRFKISCVHNPGEKLRLEGFLLPGDEESVEFRPAPFRLTASQSSSSAAVAVALGHESSRRFDSDSTATFRVVLVNKVLYAALSATERGQVRGLHARQPPAGSVGDGR